MSASSCCICSALAGRRRIEAAGGCPRGAAIWFSSMKATSVAPVVNVLPPTVHCNLARTPFVLLHAWHQARVCGLRSFPFQGLQCFHSACLEICQER